MNELPLNPQSSDKPVLRDLSRHELIELIEAQFEAGIHINFAGKSNARRIARQVRPRTLKEIKKYGAGTEEERAQNLVIEGDNLQAMATLYKDRGQVDLIVADPPYNTGNDFRYNDRWEKDPNDSGLGEFVRADDTARHTKWMRFMWPRLQMMKSMLKPTGVLAICIDYRELFRLGQMLDELFGEDKRLAIINWQKAYAPKNHEQNVSSATEYVLVYARNVEQSKTGLLERSEVTTAGYRNPDRDPKGVWVATDPTAPGASTHAGQLYAIQNPFTGLLVYPSKGRCWKNEKSKIRAWLEEWGSAYEERDIGDGLRSALLLRGARLPIPADPLRDPVIQTARAKAQAVYGRGQWPQLFFRKAGDGTARFKTYLADVKQGVVPTTYWADELYEEHVELGSVSWPHTESGHSQAGIKEVDAIVGRGHGFETVKPLKLITKIIQLWCPPTGLVLGLPA